MANNLQSEKIWVLLSNEANYVPFRRVILPSVALAWWVLSLLLSRWVAAAVARVLWHRVVTVAVGREQQSSLSVYARTYKRCATVIAFFHAQFHRRQPPAESAYSALRDLPTPQNDDKDIRRTSLVISDISHTETGFSNYGKAHFETAENCL